jgi:hypothetical protein
MIVRNFSEVFRHVNMFAEEGWTGVIMLGTGSKQDLFEVSEQTLAERIASRPIGRKLNARAVARAISANIGYDEALMRRRAAEYPPVTDDRPYTEFPLFRFFRGETYYSKNDFVLKAVPKR